MKIKQELIDWWLPLIALCLIAYWIQINTYLDGDSAIISHTAALMLLGQTYTHFIFEPNPPLIFYLHMPAILLAKLTDIKIIYCLRFYLLFLIVLCLTCSRILFAKLFKHHALLINSMSYALAIILLLLPVLAFGQREHLMLILTLPYLLLATCRFENKLINKSFAILIGLMAGIGFSIKPFFLPTWLLIELAFVVSQKSLLGWLRIESVLASLFILIYGLSVIVFFPTYWQVVLPLWMPYYRGIVQPWWTLIIYPYFVFCCAALTLSIITQKEKQNASIKKIFRLAIIGYLLAFLIPGVVWYYHILPALSVACLYFVLFFYELTERITHSSARTASLAGIGLLAIAVLSMPVESSVIATLQQITYFHKDNPIHQLTVYLNQHTPNNTYDFFSMTLRLYDLEYYSTAHYVGSLSFFSWEYNRLAPQKYSMAYWQHTLAYMQTIVSHDLDDNKPQFVIVDIPSSLILLKQRIDYPKEYVNNEVFRQAWSHYNYATTIGPYDVYQRKSPGDSLK